MDTCKRYHKDIYFPESWGAFIESFLQGITTLTESWHGHVKEHTRKTAKVTREDLNPQDIFELAYNEQGNIQRAAFRIKHLDAVNDVVVVVAHDGRIVTTWLNHKNDVHKRLNKSLYTAK